MSPIIPYYAAEIDEEWAMLGMIRGPCGDKECGCISQRLLWSLIRARMDTLESRRAVLTERFFRRSVLHEASCLHYLLPDKRDSSVTDRLRHAKTFQSIQARTNKFRNSFLPFCLEHFD